MFHQGCSTFTYSTNDHVYFCNNEDYFPRADCIWFKPSTEDIYGLALIGHKTPDYYMPQGGMNEKGLAFDTNTLPELSLNLQTELPKPRKWIPRQVLEDCSTVQEAIKLAESHSWGEYLPYQLHFADATGDAVIMSVGPDGEPAYSRKGDKMYLISTNFNVAYPENGEYPCNRYETITKMLMDYREKPDISIEDLAAVLEKVSYDSAFTNTVYSNIFDLTELKIHLYFFHQFSNSSILDLTKELSDEPHFYAINQLMTHFTRRMAKRDLASQLKEVPRLIEEAKETQGDLLSEYVKQYKRIMEEFWEIKDHELWTETEYFYEELNKIEEFRDLM